MIKQSFCIECFVEDRTPASYLKTIAFAAKTGYAAFELWGYEGMPFDKVCKMASDHGIAIASMCGASSLAEGLNKRANHATIRDQLRKSLDLARQRGIANLICFSGNRYGVSDDECLPILVEGLNAVKGDAEKAGICLNLELLNSRYDHPGYQADRSAWGFEAVRRVSSPCVKTLYDIYHMQIMEGDLIRTITDGVGHIGHFHTAGNPGRHDLDESQEIQYPAVFRAIRKTGFSGYIAHEFFPIGDKLPALKAAFDLTNRELKP
jgi:hydroxypyruvate isomerase